MRNPFAKTPKPPVLSVSRMCGEWKNHRLCSGFATGERNPCQLCHCECHWPGKPTVDGRARCDLCKEEN